MTFVTDDRVDRMHVYPVKLYVYQAFVHLNLSHVTNFSFLTYNPFNNFKIFFFQFYIFTFASKILLSVIKLHACAASKRKNFELGQQ